jgi:hypothetical protein
MALSSGSAEVTKRRGVLVSYSRHDAGELRQLRNVLAPLIHNRGLELWVDEDMRAGVEWPVELANALGACSVGVLLVTADYLASSFIRTRELEPLLEAHARGEKTLVWVAVGHCRYEQTRLGQLQAANNPDRPIKTLPLAEQERAWVEVSRKIEAAVFGSVSAEPAGARSSPVPALPMPAGAPPQAAVPTPSTHIAIATTQGQAFTFGDNATVNISALGKRKHGSGTS